MKICLAIGLLLAALLLRAEPPCANHRLQQHLSDPAYWKALELTEAQLLAYSQTLRTGPDSILSIPVVFHILHTGEAVGNGSNISDARILANLLTTNRAWHDTVDRGADMAVQFCLAQTDPNGNPTNGIVRVNASTVPNYTAQGIGYGSDPGASETALKNLSNWPHERYYNIWVVNKIAGGWAGFAYYPTGSNFSNDGTIIAANSVKAGNEVLAHELGHGLGLYHTFQGDDNGCPANDNCSTQGDRVCDTPPHQTADCVLSPCASGDLTNSIWNIMSYCSLSRVLFTEGQKTRSRNAAFTTTRLALLSSTVCNYVCPSINTERQAITCAADSAGTISDTLRAVSGCDSIVHTTYTLVPGPSADFTYTFSGPFTIDFSLTAAIDSGTSVYWNFGDATIASDAAPQHTYTAPGSYTVTLTLSNACGSDTTVQTISLLPTGIRENEAERLILYPNPTKGIFFFEWPGNNINVGEIRILNLLGQTVANYSAKSGAKQEVRLPGGLVPGTYFVQVISETGVTLIPLILE